MLTEPMIQLLTAFVDGEMSQRQRKAAMRLLNKSSEARELLRQMQENAHKVKKLPRHKVEPSLVDAVMQAIAERQAQPAPVVQPRRRRAWMPYLAATMAASLLIAVVGLIYWNATRPEQDRPKNDYVQNNDGNKNLDPTPTPPTPPAPTPAPKRVNPLLADLAKITEGTVRDFGAPIVEDRPFSALFADLKKDGKATMELTRQLNRESAIYLEITVTKNSQALTRLQSVLKDQKINVAADPAAKKTQDNKKAEYFVYAENLTSGDLALLMNELSESYVVPGANNQKNAPSPYNKVTVTPLAKEEKQKLAKLLGVETLERKEAKPETKAERAVVLLPGSAGSQPSAEVRRFVTERRGSQPGAVQVLIKIRQD